MSKISWRNDIDQEMKNCNESSDDIMMTNMAQISEGDIWPLKISVFLQIVRLLIFLNEKRSDGNFGGNSDLCWGFEFWAW